MINTFQGPAPFEAVINKAAQLRAEKENYSELAKQSRFQQLKQLAKEADESGAFDLRRNRAQRKQLWEEHKELIAELTRNGHGCTYIADRLSKLGFTVDDTDVREFQNREGLRQSLRYCPKKGESKLDRHKDFILTKRKNGMTLSKIAEQLTSKFGCSVSASGVDGFIKKWSNQ